MSTPIRVWFSIGAHHDSGSPHDSWFSPLLHSHVGDLGVDVPDPVLIADTVGGIPSEFSGVRQAIPDGDERRLVNRVGRLLGNNNHHQEQQVESSKTRQDPPEDHG